VRLLVEDWDRMRGIISSFTADEKHYALQSIAYALHKASAKSFEKGAFIRSITPFLSQRGNEHHSSDLLDELVYRTSLIRPILHGDRFEFVHFSIQEFFAAAWAVRVLSKGEVQTLLFQEWWRNCIRFYCGLTRTMDGLIHRRKGVGKGKILWLAEYLAEADFTSAKTKTAILEMIEKEVVGPARLSEQEIEYAARSGDELIGRPLRRVGANPRLVVNFGNYLRLLACINSQKAQSVFRSLVKDEDVIDQMRPSEIIEGMVASGRRGASEGVWLSTYKETVLAFPKRYLATKGTYQVLSKRARDRESVVRDVCKSIEREFPILADFRSWLLDNSHQGGAGRSSEYSRMLEVLEHCFGEIAQF